ncbi:MAG: hypothetical protein COW04_10230 [Deltaproteobacteria bacterium CG12_big_fil_rev_8_21_14_0_65_43_10]|nr:MAG: hypothetical protein AUK23_05020 [Deltaproteobacteria bacterium CG2_30_43_15]PIQ44945.1 MAG: hypothetical protein COW04_10230 [Deltaproteobacteria bacterium CG12_big_fil_rev_8_21_14_0_65_43_10]PIU85828.1 MAG: hypothetical protein COS67_05805 [Deltaproteobacteria bacterium CG06_land_8_20_14_3_00_44_19]PIX24738.1 MAG: hypothetical protein COZ68_05670 [Deltaproteobacteria bacterium CG_4_8_14_3_um_filter_43_13]PIZ19576.1 MAG: hypothetical protein COY50_09255 [Deltaproteobacteria bacterium C
MKIRPPKRLFWFIKEGTEIDLSDKRQLDMYVQQIMSRGITSDVKGLFDIMSKNELLGSFARIKIFLPSEVRKFWEEALGDTH